MPMSPSPLVRLGAFRDQPHVCFTRRADALFELSDALLCAQAVPSLPHLSLEPVHRRGWGSADAALACGRIEVERLRDLLASSPGARRPAGVRGRHDHLAALRRRVLARARLLLPPLAPFGRPADHRRLGLPVDHPGQLRPRLLDRPSRSGPAAPLDDTDQQAARQIRALLARLPAGQAVPLFVFDGGYDSAQLTLDLAEQRAMVLVRLRADRCFYADPPPAARSPKGGRPRRHGAKFAFADPTTWPTPSATLVCQDDQYGTVTVAAWSGLHPKQQRHPGHGSRGPRPIVRGTIVRVQVERVPARTRPPKCCGCGGPGPAGWISTSPGGPTSAGST
jgi:hypothetical protein